MTPEEATAKFGALALTITGAIVKWWIILHFAIKYW